MQPVLLIGRLLMDQYLLIKEYPARGQDAVIKEAFECVGGCTYNAAATIKNLGGDALILSPINRDERGKRILFELQARGFRDDLLFEVDGATTYCLVLLDDEGERTFLTYTGSQGDLIGPKAAAAVDLHAAYVHLSGYSLVEMQHAAALFPLLQDLKQTGTKILFDPGPLCKEIEAHVLKQILHLSDIVCLNNAEVQMIESHLNLNQGFFVSSSYLKNERLVVIKEGARGASAYSQAGTFFAPAFSVHSVDGTGAGDSFAGGLLFALARGDELEAALRFANACGALTAAVLGPQAAFTLPDIEKLWLNGNFRDR